MGPWGLGVEAEDSIRVSFLVIESPSFSEPSPRKSSKASPGRRCLCLWHHEDLQLLLPELVARHLGAIPPALRHSGEGKAVRALVSKIVNPKP